MYGSTGGKVLGPSVVGGAGLVASDTEVSPAGLARTGGPLLVLTALAMALLVIGFLLLRARLRAGEDGA